MTKRKIIKSQRGQGLIEYLIIVALVAAGSIAIMRTVGQTVQLQFAKVSKGLGAKTVDNANLETPTISKSSYSKKSMSNFLSGSISSGRGTGNDSEQTEDNPQE